ncbi:MAG: Ig-like domain repeat protein [Planctomycetes bacterium]|nr:Ig-like domain repeat protein [Planctomycetota bacterium]
MRLLRSLRFSDSRPTAGTLIVLTALAAFATPSANAQAPAPFRIANPGPGCFFGESVAIRGDTAIVGADRDACGSGVAHVFVRDGASWVLHQNLVGSGSTMEFGGSVALSDDGSTAIVGAYERFSGQPGSVYVFGRSGTFWTETARLRASDPGPGETWFGYSVSLSGDTLLVGCPFKNSAYVFVQSGGTWTEQQKLTPSPASARFGWSVALSGDTALVGADEGNAAYVYVRSGTTWTQQARLTAGDAAAGDRFGWSVGLAGDTAVVGALFDDNEKGVDAGAGYVFVRTGATWTEQAKLIPNATIAGKWVGYSAALSGDMAVFGSGGATGAAYVFLRAGTTWIEQPSLVPDVNFSGTSVALDGNSRIIFGNRAAEAAYVFDVVPPVVPELSVARESIESALIVDLDAEGSLDYVKTGGFYQRQEIKKFVAPIAAPESWKIRRNVAFNPDPAGNLGFNYPAFAPYGQVGGLYVSSFSSDRVDFLYSDAWCWAGQIAGPVGGETTVTTSGEGSAANGFSYGCALEASETETRVARIYNGGYATKVRMDLSWDEFQTIAVTSIFDPLTDLAPTNNGQLNFANKYTIRYKATAPGQWLSVRFTAITPTYRDQYATLRFAAVTLAGNDNTPPTVTITAPTDESVTSAGSTMVSAIIADDSATTITSNPVGIIDEALSAPGGTVAGAATLTEGANAITVSAADAGSNTSSTSITIYRDSVAPAVTVSPGEGTIVSEPLSNFGITVTDQTLTSVTIGGIPAGSAAVENGGVYGTSSATLTGAIPVWSEGPNSIVVIATDAAGNTTSLTRTVILDSTAPVIEILSPPNGACFTSAPPAGIPLSATISDANATEITGALTGSLPAAGGTLSGTFVLQEGLNPITITATNPGLNPPVFATQTVNVTLDTIAPTVTITSPGDQACVRGSVEVHATATDVLPGTVSATTYFVDGVAIAPTGIDPVLYLLDTTTLADGPHTVQVDATDSCGNETSTSITIQVDNTAPELTIQSPLDLAWVAGNVNFDASASDLGTGLAAITMTAAGQAPTTDGSLDYLAPVSFGSATSQVDTVAASNGVDGDMEFEVTARDCAGNTTTVSVTVHVDNNPPETAIITPADGATVRCVSAVKATVDEPNLASVQFLIDGFASPVLTAPPFEVAFDTRTRLDGAMPITLVVTDLANNVTTTSITVTVDNLEVELEPETLELKARGGDKSVTAKIEGQSAPLLAAVNPQDITLCVPGGSPIPASLVHGLHLGWVCDHEHESSHRGHRRGHEHGHHGSESAVKVKFDRQLLLGALRGAGLTDGKVEVTIKVTQDGQTFVIGSDKIRVRSGGGHH